MAEIEYPDAIDPGDQVELGSSLDRSSGVLRLWLRVDGAVRASAGEPSSGLGVGSGRPLTDAERRVANLVAEGLTNVQVARTLQISPRTVEGHLSRVYAKLGVPSRSRLIVTLAEADA